MTKSGAKNIPGPLVKVCSFKSNFPLFFYYTLLDALAPLTGSLTH